MADSDEDQRAVLRCMRVCLCVYAKKGNKNLSLYIQQTKKKLNENNFTGSFLFKLEMTVWRCRNDREGSPWYVSEMEKQSKSTSPLSVPCGKDGYATGAYEICMPF